MNLILTVVSFLMNIDVSGFLVVIAIISIPLFFFFRRIYRRKFQNNKRMVLAWSIATSILLSTIFVVGSLALLVFWLIRSERG